MFFSLNVKCSQLLVDAIADLGISLHSIELRMRMMITTSNMLNSLNRQTVMNLLLFMTVTLLHIALVCGHVRTSEHCEDDVTIEYYCGVS